MIYQGNIPAVWHNPEPPADYRVIPLNAEALQEFVRKALGKPSKLEELTQSREDSQR